MTTTKTLFTALDRRNDLCSHGEYWSQFVTPSILHYVQQRIGLPALLASTDEHLNDIPLGRWDGMNTAIRQMVDTTTWKHCHNATYGEADRDKFIWSPSCGVCIGKAAARMIISAQYKRGEELEVGNVVICEGYKSKTITSFDEHPGLTRDDKHHTARIMRSGDYGITVFYDDCYRLTTSGAYIATHLWADYEKKHHAT